MAFATAVPVALGKIHEDSNVTANEKLDLFKVPPTETTETGGTWISVQPMTEASSSQLQLLLPPTDEYYTDLQNSYVVLECKVTKADDTDLDDAATGRVYPVSNFPHALFERVTCSLNSHDVDHNSAYAQTAYIRSLIDETKDSKEGRMTGEGWLDDDATGKDEGDAPAAAKTTRKGLIAESKSRSYFMRPFMAMDRQTRALPPGVAVRVTFNRSSPASCLMSSQDEDVKIVVTKFEWMVRRIAVNPSIVRAQNARLIEGATYKFPLKKHRTRTHTIPAGVKSHRLVVDQDDVIPNRILVSMLDHAAFVGDFARSPYKFYHNGLTSIELTVDGVTVGKRIETDFANGKYSHAYAHTLASLGALNSNKSNGIAYDEFGDGKTVFAWCTATDLPNKDRDRYFHLRRKACVALKLSFSEALARPLSVQITDEREDLLELDLENRVKTVAGVV